MMWTTHTFEVCKASARYTCTCSECGKTLNRVVVAEHTINPFNKNEDGRPKSRSEVYRSAYIAAEQRAAALQGEPAICRNCDEAPMKALLLEMAGEPQRIFAKSEKFWNSPMHFLYDRKQVEDVWSGRGMDAQHLGYRITRKGIERAAKFR